MDAVSKLIELVVSIWKDYKRKLEQQRAQDAKDNLEDDPAKWFDDHFSGLPSDATKKASKANSENSDAK